jgi:hypothetical protein
VNEWWRDVFELVPPTEDTVLLDHVWTLDGEDSPVRGLLMWQPADEPDKAIRDFLLTFARKVIEAERLRARGQR